MLKEQLIALTLVTCPPQFVPDKLPAVALLSDSAYETMEARAGYSGSIGLAIFTGDVILLKKSRTNERVLCHELRHFVDGHFHAPTNLADHKH